MKMLIGFFAFALSFASLASTGETKSFLYDGSQNSVELLLRGEQTHTEYRVEEHRTTCYRTGIIGYRTVCTGGGRPGPRGPRGPRGPYPGPRHCYQQPIYGQIPYPCTQTVRIPYEVKDFDVEARVIVDVTKLSDVASVENFRVTLNGDQLSIDVQGSRKFFVMLKKRDVRTSGNGSVKYLDGLFAVELLESAPVLKALDMGPLSYENGELRFGMDNAVGVQNLGFALHIEKRPIFGSNTVIFDRELAPSEIEVNQLAGIIDLSKIGVGLAGGRYGLTPKVFFKAEGTLLNRSQFETLEASRTLILKL